jgi:nucleoside-diphosphate-sugar epimerase
MIFQLSKVKMFEPDVLIFGYGKLTQSLIKCLIEKKKKIVCVSNNYVNQLQSNPRDFFQVFTSKQVINLQIQSSLTIFNWREIENSHLNSQGLVEWLSSEKFTSDKSFFLSSASVYMDSQLPVNESESNLDLNVMKNKKYLLEIFFNDFMKLKKIPHVNLRLSNVYGEGLSYGLIGSIHNYIRLATPLSIFVDLGITRDYIYISDLINGIENLAKIELQESVINVSTGVSTSIFDILSVFENLGYDLKNKVMQELPKSTKLNSVLDCSKLQKLITWHPVSVNDGISKLMGVNL